MGKKMGLNEKVVEARERKGAAKAAAGERERSAKEDAEWSKHENPSHKRDAKRQEEDKKKEEAAAKRLEAKRLAAEEEAAMASFGKKKPAAKPSATKVTSHQLSTMKEREARQAEAAAAERADASSRTVKEADYAAAVEVENVNKPSDEGVEARSIEGAIGALSLGGGDADADRNPEKRAKAAFNDFYEAMLPQMKADKPGLRLMQYKSMIFEKWSKSPLNPRNTPQK